MIIEYKAQEMEEKEHFYHCPYVGYFAPDGTLIDFNVLFGTAGHDEWRNPVSQTYLKYISYILLNTSKQLEDYQKKSKNQNYSEIERNRYKEIVLDHIQPGISNFVVRGFQGTSIFNNCNFDEFFTEIGKEIKKYSEDEKEKGSNPYWKFQYHLLSFFQKAYKNNTFFSTIDKKIEVVSFKNYIETYHFQEENENIQKFYYEDTLKKMLMNHFKDIAIMYLGYDAINQVKADNHYISFPSNMEEYDFDDIPRAISTSCVNPNERFWNYLIMDWKIDRMPCYLYNEETQKFERLQEGYTNYQTEKEESLEKEIQLIKQKVPRKKRYQFLE